MGLADLSSETIMFYAELENIGIDNISILLGRPRMIQIPSSWKILRICTPLLL